ncbi:TIGR02530 family flagellar biosynthesis protein [Salipaludibacillus daqingensis]|uniref:TIGR02530 family flagellar biosynthesis protein n=1 Tax=Salipaludibacillus daqingensis TaxID=3041001 RepID=UPI0024738A5F|nr:TIGR02530 family flagellar biosynthesis protein [Salipaludibacillus daqingensis]
MSPKIMPHHLQQPLPKPPVKRPVTQNNAENSFQNMLASKIDEQQKLKISKHAEQRLMDRGIEVSGDVWNEIHSKVKEAKQKGVQDSLVLTNDAAFVVSAKNDTVITAMDREEAASQLFTNINGAIIINK